MVNDFSVLCIQEKSMNKHFFAGIAFVIIESWIRIR